MNVIGVYGDCLLALTPTFEVLCAQTGTKQLLARWPFDCLKSFSYGNGLFSFVAGRHSPHGPGEYSFITGQDKVIHKTLEKLIDKAKRGSYASSSSSRHSVFSGIDQRAPMPTPDEQQGARNESPVSTTSSSSSSSDGGDRGADASLRKRAQPNDYIKRSPPLEGEEVPPQPPVMPPPRLPPKGPGMTPTKPSEAWLSDHYRHAATIQVGTTSPGQPPSPTLGTGEEHFYSHTIHRYPATIHSPTPSDDPNVYNSLVRQKTAPVGGSRGPSERKGDYEVAYPKEKLSPQQQKAGDYSMAYKEGERRAASRSPVPTPLSTLRTREGTDSRKSTSPLPSDDNGMTANPLYGSQANLLEDLITHPLASPATSDMPDVPSALAAMSASDPSSEATTSPKAKIPAVTPNPVYVESPLATESPSTGPRGESTQGAVTSVSNGAAAHSTEKDGKGYTKVSKTSPPLPADEEESTSSEPPPLPERHYDPEQ